MEAPLPTDTSRLQALHPPQDRFCRLVDAFPGQSRGLHPFESAAGAGNGILVAIPKIHLALELRAPGFRRVWAGVRDSGTFLLGPQDSFVLVVNRPLNWDPFLLQDLDA